MAKTLGWQYWLTGSHTASSAAARSMVVANAGQRQSQGLERIQSRVVYLK